MPVKNRSGTADNSGPISATDAGDSASLSSFTSAWLFVEIFGGSANDLKFQITYDPFSVADASCEWFDYLGSVGDATVSLPNGVYEVPAGAGHAVPFPPCSTAYGVGNLTSLAGRRMRIVNSGSNVVTDGEVVGHRRIA